MSWNFAIRPRRNRASQALRNLVAENHLQIDDFICPIFVQEGTSTSNLENLPHMPRYCLDEAVTQAVHYHQQLGIQAILLFGYVDVSKRTPCAKESLNSNGITARAVQAIKSACPTLTIFTDVALDPYNSDGHDGIVSQQSDSQNSHILNDITVDMLCQQSLMHAIAGADFVAPSDMMDGRVHAIRKTLDSNGYQHVGICSYSVKYASALYGPFRSILDSAPQFGDKKTYQMNPANSKEAIREAVLDQKEGADMLMIKPAGFYLDIIQQIANQSTLPTVAYQVSGEYSMIEAAAQQGSFNRKQVILESLMAIKRAGADIIVSYYTPEVATWLSK